VPAASRRIVGRPIGGAGCLVRPRGALGGEEVDTIARCCANATSSTASPGTTAPSSRTTAARCRTSKPSSRRETPTSSGQGRTLGETRAVRDLLQLVDLAARESWSHDDVFDALAAAVSTPSSCVGCGRP
jgi:hypothetical protein